MEVVSIVDVIIFFFRIIRKMNIDFLGFYFVGNLFVVIFKGVFNILDFKILNIIL